MHTRIRPTRGWTALDPRTIWANRELLSFLIWRDLKVRYAQTALGAAWAVLQPLSMMLLFTVLFSRIPDLQSTQAPYPLFAYAALLPWTFFSNATTHGAHSLVGSAHILTKVYFPRLLIPLASILSGLVDFAVAFAFLLVLMVVYRVPPAPQIVVLPFFVLGTMVVAAGAGVLFSALIVSYRDFRYVITFVVQLWLYATPVLYTIDIIPARWRFLYAINPMVGMVAGFRASVLGGPFPLDVVLVSIVSTMLLLAVGLRYFTAVERRFADVI